MAAFLGGAGPLPRVLLLPPSWSTDGDSLLSEQEGFESPLRVLVVLPQSPRCGLDSGSPGFSAVPLPTCRLEGEPVMPAYSLLIHTTLTTCPA